MGKILYVLSAIIAMCCAAEGSEAAEENVGFTVRPDRCIALNRGQTCYQKLTFQWQTPAGQGFCLHQQGMVDPIVCWNGDEKSGHQVEFVSDRNITYVIRGEGMVEALTEVEVEVAWVYQSNRKSFSRWRLF